MASILLALEHGDPIDHILYCEIMFDKNISAEIPEHAEFIHKVAIPQLEKWGLKTEIVRADSTYKDNFNRVITESKVPERNGKIRGFVIPGRCAVNRDCKIPPIRRFYRENNLIEVTQYIGIAVDEPKRLKRLEGTNKVSLLEKYGYTEKMAKELCRQNGLLSPIYAFTDRGGCFFCPNCKDAEFQHLRQHHPELWGELLKMAEAENQAWHLFNRTETLKEIDERLFWAAAQMTIEEFI